MILLCLVMCVVCVAGFAQAASSGVSLVKQDEGWQFLEDGQPVMFYRTVAKSLDGKYARADYVHPLVGLDGQVITEDFPEDHLHHRGIFWTWHQLLIKGQSIGDAWLCEDFIWDVHEVRVVDKGPETVGLQATVLWKSPLWQNGKTPMVKETVTIQLSQRKKNCRQIDFTIGLLALQDDTWLGGSDNVKGYGGFTARIATPEDAVLDSAVGRVKPLNTPVFGGPWINITGTLNGKPYGAAIFQHPDNPLFPEAWILRTSKRFSDMQNPVYPWRYPAKLPTKKPTVLRYRLLLHKDADINAAWDVYRAQ